MIFAIKRLLWYTPEMDNGTVKNVNSRLEEIQEKILNNPGPHELAEMKVVLSGLYSRMASEASELSSKGVLAFNMTRPTFKSDRACERAFEGSEDGIRLLELNYKMKAIDKMTSAISSMLRVAENEARNIF